METAIKAGDDAAFKVYLNEFGSSYVFDVPLLIEAAKSGSISIFKSLLSRYGMGSRALLPVLKAASEGPNPDILDMIRKRFHWSADTLASCGISTEEDAHEEVIREGEYSWITSSPRGINFNHSIAVLSDHCCALCGSQSPRYCKYCSWCGTEFDAL